ncbi:hypothetical protein AB1Y20_000008 [Prymnesium parvum]|uniref:N-acetyltransferase domain-containing protein n=1 Tax=Prymnesium parvum TaxID=97485 RepID=A0AB34K8R2_PRYPA
MAPSHLLRSRRRATVTRGDAKIARQHLETIRYLVYSSFPEQFAEAGADEGEDLFEALCGVHSLEQALFLFCRLPSAAPVGFALAFNYGDALYVSTLCIDQRHRCMGFGSLLLRSASALAHSMGIPKLTGSVDAASEHLRCFYERLGAVPRPLAPCGPDTSVFTRRLDAPSGPATAQGVPVPVIDHGRDAAKSSVRHKIPLCNVGFKQWKRALPHALAMLQAEFYPSWKESGHILKLVRSARHSIKFPECNDCQKKKAAYQALVSKLSADPVLVQQAYADLEAHMKEWKSDRERALNLRHWATHDYLLATTGRVMTVAN